jgi:hypothetical protein
MRAPHSYFSATRQDHPEMRSSVQKADDRMAGDCSLRCLGGMTALGHEPTATAICASGRFAPIPAIRRTDRAAGGDRLETFAPPAPGRSRRATKTDSLFW